MTDVKHTPGPWFLEQTDSALWIGVEKAAGGKVGDVITSLEYGSDYNPWHNEVALANARLIAAAPDLLAMLKVAQLWLDIDGRYDMQGINAAIAKATNPTS